MSALLFSIWIGIPALLVLLALREILVLQNRACHNRDEIEKRINLQQAIDAGRVVG